MHKLLILEYNHNLKTWYQNLAEKAVFSITDTSFELSCQGELVLQYENYTEVNKDDITLHYCQK